MFTDIVGSTAVRDRLVLGLGEARGDAEYRRLVLDLHNERIRAVLSQHRGFEVKTIGDSFMASFETPAEAIECAAAIQRDFGDHPLTTESGPLSVRIGMHTGQPALHRTPTGWDYDGAAVNIAARVEALLRGGGQVLCSAATAELARHLPGIRYHRCGEYRLKGIAEPVDVFEVLWHDGQEPQPPPQAHQRLPYPWQVAWVGRHDEVEALRCALRTAKQVTLLGSGGVGKTRLAIETILAHANELPPEIQLVALEECRNDREAFLAAVRDGVGLTELDAPDLAALCSRLAGTERLLVLDNFETVMAAAEVVPVLASVTGLRILVTSQQALDYIGEKVVALEPMATTGQLDALDSFRLFVEVATRRDPRWAADDAAAMRRVLELTDGLPYVIEIVAARAPFAPLTAVAEGIRLETLAIRGSDAGRPSRHSSVKACWAWSVRHLAGETRTALARAAVFAGSFDSAAAHEVASIGVDDLAALIDASFLRFDRVTGRYSMLATTRELAVELLDANEGKRLSREHAAYYVASLHQANDALLKAGGELQAQGRREIDRELPNIRAAMAWAERGDVSLFRKAVLALSSYQLERSQFTERLRLAAILVELSDVALDEVAWAKAQQNLGVAYADLPTGRQDENLAQAIKCYEGALQVFTQRSHPFWWALTQNRTGVAHARLAARSKEEHLRKAINHFEAAQRVWTVSEHPRNWATVQNNIALAYLNLSTGDPGADLSGATGRFEAALHVATEHDFPLVRAMVHLNLGILYARLPRGDREQNIRTAIGHFEAARLIWTKEEFPVDWAKTQNNLGTAYTELESGEQEENVRKAIECF